jgi:multidrug efflux pump subunit AcrB
MSLSTPFIRRPVATSLLMITILLAGVISYPALPIAPLPQIDFPTIVVSATLPGASPETITSSVATPLERQFGQISGVTQMTSASSFGQTTITLQFDLNRNIDAAAQDVQAAINAASGQLSKHLPNPPIFRKVNPADSPILLVAVTSDNHTITETSDYADTILAQQISQISGVAQVLILGEQKPAVRVQIDPLKLASVGLGLEDVRSVVSAATLDGPKGNFDGAAQSRTIYNNDQLLRTAEYNDIV